MKAKDLIQMFTNDYNPDDELMLMWWDSAFREHTAGTWKKAIEAFYDGAISTFSIDEQITELLSECERELVNETN